MVVIEANVPCLIGRDQMTKLVGNMIAAFGRSLKEFGVFEMPYIVQDRDHMRRIQAELGDVFQEAALSEGYRIIGYFENGFRHITNNTRAIVLWRRYGFTEVGRVPGAYRPLGTTEAIDALVMFRRL